MYDFLSIFLLFITYSFLGWIVESIYCSYKEKKLINRGFLIGPYCPIYGSAAVLILLFLSGYSNDLFVLFTISILLSGIVEYLTSYYLEKIFKLSLWDYSNNKFNINGRICLKNLLYFGILAVLLIKYINPFIYNLYMHIPYSLLWTLLITSLIVFIADLTLTIFAIYDIKKVAHKILDLDELSDIRDNMFVNVQEDLEIKAKYMKIGFISKNAEILEKIQNAAKIRFNYIHKRFMNAFPNIKSIDNNQYLEYLKNLFKND